MGKINKLLNELQEEIKKETGLNSNIDINFHKIRQRINFKKANKVANIFYEEIGGDKIIWKSENSKGINVENYASKNEKPNITIFFE